MTKRFLVVILLLLIFLNSGYSQIKSIGVPFIRNYPKREYKAGKAITANSLADLIYDRR